MESITLSVELVLPGWDCPGSSAERDGLIDQRRRRLRERCGREKRKEQECGYLEVREESSMWMCEGGSWVIGLISPVCLSSLGSRSGSISRPGARLQLLMPLLPTLHSYLQEGAVVWWSAILVIIASSKEMNEQRGKAISYLVSFSFLPPINTLRRCAILCLFMLKIFY